MPFSSFGQRFAIGALVCTSIMFSAGCGSDPAEPEFGFGEADMQNAIVGNWSGTMSISGQTPTAFTLSIARKPTLQPACGSRAFNGPLCIETSSMSLEGTLSTADKMFDAVKLQGSFMVFGIEMTGGELWLSGSGVDISGNMDVAKTSQDLTIAGDHKGNATMQR